jgi:hypothetical protein
MMLIHSNTDYYSLRASLGRTGKSGTAISHSLPTCGCATSPADCTWSFPNCRRACCRPGASMAPVARASLLRLDAWVGLNAEPPASVLMPLESASGEPPALRAPNSGQNQPQTRACMLVGSISPFATTKVQRETRAMPAPRSRSAIATVTIT